KTLSVRCEAVDLDGDVRRLSEELLQRLLGKFSIEGPIHNQSAVQVQPCQPVLLGALAFILDGGISQDSPAMFVQRCAELIRVDATDQQPFIGGSAIRERERHALALIRLVTGEKVAWLHAAIRVMVISVSSVGSLNARKS